MIPFISVALRVNFKCAQAQKVPDTLVGYDTMKINIRLRQSLKEQFS